MGPAIGAILTVAGIVQYRASGQPEDDEQSKARSNMTVGLAPIPGGGAIGRCALGIASQGPTSGIRRRFPARLQLGQAESRLLLS